VFSIEFVQDHPESEIAARINELVPPGEWRFYFNAEPSEALRRELSAIIR
jgi:hypothetical protein